MIVHVEGLLFDDLLRFSLVLGCIAIKISHLILEDLEAVAHVVIIL